MARPVAPTRRSHSETPPMVTYRSSASPDAPRARDGGQCATSCSEGPDTTREGSPPYRRLSAKASLKPTTKTKTADPVDAILDTLVTIPELPEPPCPPVGRDEGGGQGTGGRRFALSGLCGLDRQGRTAQGVQGRELARPQDVSLGFRGAGAHWQFRSLPYPPGT